MLNRLYQFILLLLIQSILLRNLLMLLQNLFGLLFLLSFNSFGILLPFLFIFVQSDIFPLFWFDFFSLG